MYVGCGRKSGLKFVRGEGDDLQALGLQVPFVTLDDNHCVQCVLEGRPVVWYCKQMMR